MVLFRPRYCIRVLLESEADAEFVNHVAATFRIGGEEIEVDLGAGGEDEPAVLGANSKVEADAIHVVYGFANHEARNGTNIPAVFVVLVDMAELDGEDDGAGGSGLFLDVVGGSSNVVASDA